MNVLRSLSFLLCLTFTVPAYSEPLIVVFGGVFDFSNGTNGIDIGDVFLGSYRINSGAQDEAPIDSAGRYVTIVPGSFFRAFFSS